jgi:uncharacterized repeat protein (TIGR03809 family)
MMMAAVLESTWVSMAPATPLWKSDEVSLRWRSLAERRRAHFVELYNSGRWRRYYSEEAFLTQMREAVRGAEAWARLVDPSAAKTAGGTLAALQAGRKF